MGDELRRVVKVVVPETLGDGERILCQAHKNERLSLEILPHALFRRS
jgi:hypothetical protein